MRTRITRALVTAAAAGATLTTLGFATVGSAGAAVHNGPAFAPSAPQVATNVNCDTSGTFLLTHPLGYPYDNCAMAGYEASNRDFRYAQALITIPTANAGISVYSSPQMYVGLDASTTDVWNFVRAGISRCVGFIPFSGARPVCPVGVIPGSWVAYAQEFRNGTAMGTSVVSLSGAKPGDGVFASVYRELSGNVVQVRLVVPTAAGSHTYTYAFAYPGATFTSAQALADWTLPHELATGTIFGGLPQLLASKARLTQFFQGAFTTQSGDHGTFSGPWTLMAPEATTNANLPPLGTLVVEPSYLWNDGLGNGWGDAFGVWIGPF